MMYMNIFRYFFEGALDTETNEAHRHLFRGLKIMQTGEDYSLLQCSFPVMKRGRL